MELQQEWLETILSRHSSEKSVSRVTRIETDAVVNKGDNYASDMTRVRIEVILGSGKRTTRNLIMKTIPDSEMRAKFLKDTGVFKKEIQMYKEILPCMEDLLMEIGDRSETMWGECVDYRPYDRIIMADLREQGYYMADKRKGLDFAHASLALKSLGKFHALAAVLQERGLLDIEEFKEGVFTKNFDVIQKFHDSTFTTLAKVIETTWEPEYKDIPERIRACIGNTMGKITDLFKKTDSEFNTLIHGDCWVNNMMFSYVIDSEIPASVKFIDFQMSYFNSPGIELQYFLTSSLSNDVKSKHMDELLRIYQEGLCSWLKRLDYKGGKEPTIEDVHGWLDRTAFFEFVVGCTTMNFMLSDPDDAPDLEAMFKEFEEKIEVPEMNMGPFLGKAFTERLKFILKNSIRKGVI